LISASTDALVADAQRRRRQHFRQQARRRAARVAVLPQHALVVVAQRQQRVGRGQRRQRRLHVRRRLGARARRRRRHAAHVHHRQRVLEEAQRDRRGARAVGGVVRARADRVRHLVGPQRHVVRAVLQHVPVVEQQQIRPAERHRRLLADAAPQRDAEARLVRQVGHGDANVAPLGPTRRLRKRHGARPPQTVAVRRQRRAAKERADAHAQVRRARRGRHLVARQRQLGANNAHAQRTRNVAH
jgi:hypothetical protein